MQGTPSTRKLMVISSKSFEQYLKEFDFNLCTNKTLLFTYRNKGRNWRILQDDVQHIKFWVNKQLTIEINCLN